MFAQQTHLVLVPGVHITPTVGMDFQRNHISQELCQIFLFFYKDLLNELFV